MKSNPSSEVTVIPLSPEKAEIFWQRLLADGVSGPFWLGDNVCRWAYQHAGANYSLWLISFYARMFFAVHLKTDGSTF